VTAADDRGLEDLLERLRTRFYGKYRGIVSEVEASTMRIKATVPSVLGEIATGWCMPCVPYAGKGVGFAFLPEVGSGVWIEFEGGDVSYPIWVGGYWREGEFPADAADRVKVIVTTAPHKFKFDDGQRTITLSDPNSNTVTLGSSGITLANGQSTVVVSSSSVSVKSSSVSVNNGALEVK
jgi:phage baseplate assembly protein gpV